MEKVKFDVGQIRALLMGLELIRGDSGHFRGDIIDLEHVLAF